MDNIEHIHIAKIPYTIEPKAKAELKKYLSDVRTRLDDDTADEVLHDIESRIPELLAQHHTKQGDVVSEADIKFIKKQLGEPEQFKSDNEDLSGSSGANAKKLFRDTDNAMLAGVASGIGKYFSLDANIIRVAFFALTFFYGFGIILYLFLWLLLPEAKTSAEKLTMEGKPVTVSTLQRYQSSVNKSIGSGPRVLRQAITKIFRWIALLGTGFVSLWLLVAFGALSALFYVYPFKSIVSGYGLDYLLLGLVWLGCLTFIGLLVLITMKIWGHGSSRINITAIALTVLLIVTLAGESASGLLIFNHFSDKYGGDKSVRVLNVSESSTATPKTLVVNSDSNLNITYDVTTQPIHATYLQYPGMNHPNITITDSKGIITVDSSQLSDAAPTCFGDVCRNIYLPVRVTLYGPSVQEYDNTSGAQMTVNGDTSPTAQTFNAHDGSGININNGNIGAMTVSAVTNSGIDFENTTAQSVNITVDQTSNVTSPITDSLVASLPSVCATNATPVGPDANGPLPNGILFLQSYPAHTTINGQVQTLAELEQEGCIATNF